MTPKDVIKTTIQTARNITTDYIKDLTDADLLIRPVPGMNHIAWQLGHLICSESEMIGALGHSMPALPAGFKEGHSKEASKSDDPKKFSRKSEYTALLDKIRKATLAALDKTPDSQFDKPGPEPMREYAPTVGAVFNMIGAHELMHAGQYVAVRRKLGKSALF